MDIVDDPAALAGLVTREVRTGERDGSTTRIAVAHRTYATDRDDLWDAVTSPERVPRWFLPLTGDLRTGGRYQLEGNAGGTIERCEAPDLLAVTWEFGDMVSWLTITLTAAGEGTTLVLEHESPVDPDTWTQFGTSAVGAGWDLALFGLGLHIDTGAPVDPELAAGFTLTPEGLTFVETSCAGWSAAAIADGDDAEAARAAAARTVAAYTTLPDADPSPDSVTDTVTDTDTDG